MVALGLLALQHRTSLPVHQQHFLRTLFIYYVALCFGTFRMMSVEKHASNWSAVVVYATLCCELGLAVASGVLGFGVRVEKHDV
jgi:hypothetical protein